MNSIKYHYDGAMEAGAEHGLRWAGVSDEHGDLWHHIHGLKTTAEGLEHEKLRMLELLFTIRELCAIQDIPKWIIGRMAGMAHGNQ